MLSNAIDFRARRKERPKSADFESVDELDGSPPTEAAVSGEAVRSASVHNILETVRSSSSASTTSGGGAAASKGLYHPPKNRPPLRALEARNSAPDILPGKEAKDRGPTRPRGRLGAAAVAKQKLSTRFQPQRKPTHRGLSATTTVKRAKTFSLGGGNHSALPPGFKTLPKQASSRSLGSSSSTDSGQGAGCSSNDSGQGVGSGCSQGSQSSTSSRKSSDSSCLSCDSEAAAEAAREISQKARDEIAAFEKFIQDYFESVDKNKSVSKPTTTGPKAGVVGGGGGRSKGGGAPRGKAKISTCSTLSEVLELNI